MKLLFALIFLVPIVAGAQLSGDLATDGRKVITAFDYQITGHKAGTFVFNIGVNMDGIVTICVLDQTKSDIVSTPLMMKAKNHILKNLKFERGYHFPESHTGTVTITVILEPTAPTE